MSSTSTTKATAMKVMVTGANGYIASHIVNELLNRGHTVHACVRDKDNNERVDHLKSLPNAKIDKNFILFSTGDLSNCQGKFDEPMTGCDAIIHAATPLNVKFSGSSGEESIYNPAMTSTQEVLDCMVRHSTTVKHFILTSSMSAVAPRPEPTIKDESHWSNAEEQKERGNWYGCTKTSQELLVQDFIKTKCPTTVHYCSICPTVVLGPSLNPNSPSSGTMGRLVDWCKGEKLNNVPNDSLSFVHVEDCAMLHVNALESSSSSGRYMCLVESWHWNDILKEIKNLYPSLQDFKPVDRDVAIKPTQFNLNKMNSLLNDGQRMKSNEEILSESIKYLQEKGML